MNLDKYYKLANRINIILNIIICLGVYFASSGNLIAVIIAFLILIWLSDNLNDFSNKKFSQFMIKDSKMNVQDIKLYNMRTPNTKNGKEIWSSLLFEIEKQKKELQKLKEQEEEQKKTQEEVLQRIENKELEKFNNLLHEFDIYFTSCEKTDFLYKQIETIQKILIEIKENLEEKPNSAKLIPISLYTYIREFISLMTDYPTLSNETKEQMKDYYIETTEQLIEFMKRVNKKLLEIPDKDIHIGLMTLMDELKEENKKEP